MPGHFFCKQIIEINTINCHGNTSHPQNFLNLFSFFTSFGLFVITKFVLKKVFNFRGCYGGTQFSL